MLEYFKHRFCLFVYVLGGNVCNVFKCLLPSGNRDESQKNTAISLKNSSQVFSNHIKAYWFRGYTIVEYCGAHAARRMMNFRWDFVGSPGILKLKWPLSPVQQTAYTRFRQVLLTECDLQRLLVRLRMYFHISKSHWWLFFCQQSFRLQFSMKINREPYWNIHLPEET